MDDDCDQLTPTSHIPVRLPKKGILKRSTSFADRTGDGPDLIQTTKIKKGVGEKDDKNVSRIPRPSVTWWETNAVFGDSPDSIRRIRRSHSVGDDDDPEAELESLGSSVGSSSQIAGTWWFGRSTRFVPHCEKRHRNSHNEYRTPTQRKNDEIVDLKRQLKMAVGQIDDKERHLVQLRERLDELEGMMDAGGRMNDSHRLMTRQKELLVGFQAEKQMLIDRYEHRLRTLSQEAVEARADSVRAQMHRPPLTKLSVDAQNMTDDLRGSTIDVQVQIDESSQDPDKWPAHVEVVCQSTMCIAQKQEMFAKLQAHQNEALAWRTKAVELEIIVRNRLLTLDSSSNILPSTEPMPSDDAERYRQECIRLQNRIVQLESDRNATNLPDSTREESSSSFPDGSILEQPLATKRQLADDVDTLKTQLTVKIDEFEQLSEQLNDSRREVDEIGVKLGQFSGVHEKLADKAAKCEAAKLGVQRCQDANVTLRKAVDYLERRCRLLHDTLLDAGFVVVDDDPNVRHIRRRSNPSVHVDRSQLVQTDLTSESLREHEHEFVTLNERMEQLERDLFSEKTDRADFDDAIRQQLALKTRLVQSLTRQLQLKNDQIETSVDQAERQRQGVVKRLDQVSKMAERVPVLELELSRVEEERLVAKRTMLLERDRCQDTLETSLEQSLKHQQDHSKYWQQKLAVVTARHREDKVELDKLKKQHVDLKLRLNLEKVDLEQRLQDAFKQVTSLTDRLYKPMNDKLVQVKPSTVNKYVACRPLLTDKTSDIVKGDLFDETDERLKLSQGELLATRRQVEVLQQKFIENRPDDTLLATFEQLKIDKNLQKQHVIRMERRNEQLHAQLAQIETDKALMITEERERIARLVAEFDNVRQELDTEIDRYEAEKRRMKERIGNLEKSVAKKDDLRAQLKRYHDLEQLIANGVGTVTNVDMKAVEGELEVIRTGEGRSGKQEIDEGSRFLLAKLQTERQKYATDIDFLRTKLTLTVAECERMRGNVQRMNALKDSHQSSSKLRRTASNPCLNADIEQQQQQQKQADDVFMNIDKDNKHKLLHVLHPTIIHESSLSTTETISRQCSLSQQFFPNKITAHFSAPQSISGDRSPGFADLASDLNEVRVDLEGILAQMDNATVHSQSAVTTTAEDGQLEDDDRQEDLLMRWLELEVQEDKHHLDAISRWYDTDKKRLESELLTLKNEAKLSQLEMVKVKEQFGDVCRELQLYRLEAVAKAKAPVETDDDGRKTVKLGRSRSFSDSIDCQDDGNSWKTKVGTMFREMIRMRRHLKMADEERRSLTEQLTMTKGELELALVGMGESINGRTKSVDRNGTCKRMRIRVLSVDSSSRKSGKSNGTKNHSPSSSSNTFITAPGSSSPSSLSPSKSDPDFRSFDSSSSLNQSIRRRLRSVNERADHAEKQVLMISTELELLKSTVNELEMEKHDLEGRLQQMISAVEQTCPSGWKRVTELSVENRQLHQQLDRIAEQQQDALLVMFRKGWETASKELTVDDLTSTFGPAGTTCDTTTTASTTVLSDEQVVLLFLKDAVYYFLLNRDANNHLQAIMSILQFSSQQREQVHRKRGGSH